MDANVAPIRLAIDDGIAIATLDRPPVNAIDEAWVARLDAIVDGVEARDDVRVLWIRAAGRAFCAGADCLYAPGIRTREQIRTVVAAVAPKPVNVLIGWPSELSVQDLAELGVRRISVGGALARSAWGGFMRSAQMLAQQGRFDGFADAASGKELNALLSELGAGSS